jgi:hypothetical protein
MIPSLTDVWIHLINMRHALPAEQTELSCRGHQTVIIIPVSAAASCNAEIISENKKWSRPLNTHELERVPA